MIHLETDEPPHGTSNRTKRRDADLGSTGPQGPDVPDLGLYFRRDQWEAQAHPPSRPWANWSEKAEQNGDVDRLDFPELLRCPCVPLLSGHPRLVALALVTSQCRLWRASSGISCEHSSRKPPGTFFFARALDQSLSLFGADFAPTTCRKTALPGSRRPDTLWRRWCEMHSQVVFSNQGFQSGRVNLLGVLLEPPLCFRKGCN